MKAKADKKIVELLKKTLQKEDRVVNALIFGSFANGKKHHTSDIDIAIQTKESYDLSLLDLGELYLELEEATNKKIDLVIINYLPFKSPLLAYNIYLNHYPLFIKDKEMFDTFKLRALQSYLDFEPVIKDQNIFFKKRIESGTVGKTETA